MPVYPSFASPIGQPLTTMRVPFCIVPDDGLIIRSLKALIAQPPEGDYVVTIDLRRVVRGKPMPIGATPLVFDLGSPAYTPVAFAIEPQKLNAGDILELSIHVTHGGGKVQSDVGSNIFAVSGHSGSGLLVQATIGTPTKAKAD